MTVQIDVRNLAATLRGLFSTLFPRSGEGTVVAGLEPSRSFGNDPTQGSTNLPVTCRADSERGLFLERLDLTVLQKTCCSGSVHMAHSTPAVTH